MAINFPSSPAEGQVYQGFVFRSGSWNRGLFNTALPKNYFVNPAMQISNENGTAGSPAVAVGAYWPADGWLSTWDAAGVSLAVGSWAALGAGPLGSTVFMQVGTPKVSLAAWDYAMIYQGIEGNRIADLQWGTTRGIPAVLRFTTVASAGKPLGAYSVSVENIPGTHSFIAAFNITATDAWETHTITIPPPPVGSVWPTDNSCGIWFTFTVAGGSSWQGVPGWQSSVKYTLAGQANGIATIDAVHLSQVGLYPDPYGTGVAPPWVVPNYFDEERACARYWNRCYGGRGASVSATVGMRVGARYPVTMRTSPTLGIVGNPHIYDGAAVPFALATNYPNPDAFEFDASASSLTAGRPLMQYYLADTEYVAANARIT